MKQLTSLALIALLAGCASDAQMYEPQAQSRDLFDEDLDGVINARDNCFGSAQRAKTSNDGCGETVSKKNYQFKIIDFGFDKDTLTAVETSRVKDLAEEIKANPETQVYLIGDTSVEGTQEYNKALAQRRINTVESILVAQGVNRDQLIEETYIAPKHMPESVSGRETRLIAVMISPDTQAPVLLWDMYDNNN